MTPDIGQVCLPQQRLEHLSHVSCTIGGAVSRAENEITLLPCVRFLSFLDVHHAMVLQHLDSERRERDGSASLCRLWFRFYDTFSFQFNVRTLHLQQAFNEVYILPFECQ